MAILANEDTRVVVQGITGSSGSFHARACMEYGTKVVAGVTPGKGGQRFDDVVPVFDTVAEAKKEAGANATLIFVPPAFAADSVMEAIDAEMELIVIITEGIPALDMMKVKAFASERGAVLIGPNCPGVITPGQCKMGIMPGYIHKPGKVGVVSRSGTLTYEAVWQITRLGLGQSTCVGIGGDAIHGLSHLDVVKMFHDDEQTEAIVLIGEIGGSREEEAAAWLTEHGQKPTAAFIAGSTAPPGRRMGHAGAIISGSSGRASDKMEALRDAGVEVTDSPADIGLAVQRAMKRG